MDLWCGAMLLARAATLLSSPAMGYTYTMFPPNSAGSVEPPEEPPEAAGGRAVEAGSIVAGTTGELGTTPASTVELGGAVIDAPATIHSILQGLYRNDLEARSEGTFEEEPWVRRSFYEQIVFPRVAGGADAEPVGADAQVRVLELASPLHQPITKLWGEGDLRTDLHRHIRDTSNGRDAVGRVADMSTAKEGDGKQAQVWFQMAEVFFLSKKIAELSTGRAEGEGFFRGGANKRRGPPAASRSRVSYFPPGSLRRTASNIGTLDIAPCCATTH